jgi:transporter family-2 protein
MALLAVALRDPVPAATSRCASRCGRGAEACSARSSSAALLVIPQLGAAAFIALLVAGRMLASLAIDHFGLLGLVQRSVDLPRLLGVMLLIGGVVLIRR